MATTMFFCRTIKDLQAEAKVKLEFGRSSYYGNNLIYVQIDDGAFIVLDEITGREFCEAAERLAAYLGYDKPAFDDVDTARREAAVNKLANDVGAPKKAPE